MSGKMKNLNQTELTENQKMRNTKRSVNYKFTNQGTMDAELDKETLDKKNWEKVLKKIRFDPPTEDYYTTKEVKPGFNIWKTLATIFLQSKKFQTKLMNLDLRIPETFVVLGPNNYIYMKYDPIRKGILRKTELDITLNEFETIIQNQKDIRYINEDIYLFIQRSPGRFDNEINKQVFSQNGWNSKKSMASGLDYPSLLQQFIYPKSKTASITRFCYKTKNYSGLESSYGFKITNKVELHHKDFKIGLARKATLCKDYQNSFDIINVTEGVLRDLIPPCQKLVAFLELNFGVRISEIVVDFITNKKGEQVLFNVKSIQSKKAPKKIRDILEKKKSNLEELSCSVYCKLCGLLFKKDDASKILTYKLLWEFCKHLKKRGLTLKDIDFNHSSTRPCRVCDLCYMAVVSEHELVDLEQKFALVQNIPIKDLYLKVPEEKPPKNRPALLAEKLQQWRLMVYIKEIQFEQSQQHNLDLLQKEFYLQIKISSIKSSFKMKLPQMEMKTSYVNIPLKILRMFYFFSENLNIQKFLQETELEIHFTDKNNWNDIICHGSSKTISKFKNNNSNGQKHEIIIYMFFNNSQIAALKLIVGLVNDGNHNTSSMNLYKYNDVYFPDQDFYNCNILPIEWIEIFQNEKKELDKNKKRTKGIDNEFQKQLREELREEFKELKKEEEPESAVFVEAKKIIGIENYTPFCNKNELNRMLNDQYVTYSDQKKEFNNISNLKASITTRPTTSKKFILKSEIKKNSKRLSSAFPTTYKIKRSSTAIESKNVKKVFSSQNPQQFQRIDRQFLEKLEEENDLYLQYMSNLDKNVFSNGEKNTENKSGENRRQKDVEELDLIFKYNESHIDLE